MLTLENLCFRVDAHSIIDNVSIELRQDTRTVVLGPNGAGKSVLLRLCHGLLQPTAGRVRWGNDPAASVRQAMVFQRPMLLRRSVLANVMHALALGGIARKRREEIALAALDRVGLHASSRRPARVLSGGEQQRLALARAWALSPRVLFLDEPSASLDPSAAKAVENIVQAIHEAGTKIVMTTHNLGEARRMADEIVFLADGRVVEHADTETFFRSPASAEAAAFIRGELPW